MKRLKVEYKEDAIGDLEDIFSYVFEGSNNFIIAKNFTNRIFERCEKIGNVPNGGVCRPDLGENIQLIPFEKKAVILYKIENESIVIVNIIYGGREYNSLIISN